MKTAEEIRLEEICAQARLPEENPASEYLRIPILLDAVADANPEVRGAVESAAREIERLRNRVRHMKCEMGNATKNVDGCRCQRCGRIYKVDFLVDDQVWELITDIKNGSGLWCGRCITLAIENIGNYDAFQVRRER